MGIVGIMPFLLSWKLLDILCTFPSRHGTEDPAGGLAISIHIQLCDFAQILVIVYWRRMVSSLHTLALKAQHRVFGAGHLACIHPNAKHIGGEKGTKSPTTPTKLSHHQCITIVLCSFNSKYTTHLFGSRQGSSDRFWWIFQEDQHRSFGPWRMSPCSNLTWNPESPNSKY